MNKSKLKKLQEKHLTYTKSIGALRWTNKEVKVLKELIDGGITSHKFIYNEGIFPDRTMNSIKSKITDLRGMYESN
jgi:hypothetical protein